MSKLSHAGKHSVYFFKGAGYTGATSVCAVSTLVLATLTCGLFMTGIGIPLGLLTAAGTGGTAYGTVASAQKTGKNFSKAFSHCH